MEIMQLQPVRANLIYPNRNKANNPYIQTVEPIEVINTGIISTNPVGTEPISTREGNKLPFIEANTKEVTMQYLKEECITPVFSKDNEVTISHSSFIETAWEAANKVFSNERIEEPAIRVSHVIKGRIPEAIHKPVNQLLESDKTIYFSSYDVSFELPCFCADGDFFRNRGNDGRCLCDNRVNTWYPSVDGRRGNLVRHLFWRPLFTGINERTSCL